MRDAEQLLRLALDDITDESSESVEDEVVSHARPHIDWEAEDMTGLNICYPGKLGALQFYLRLTRESVDDLLVDKYGADEAWSVARGGASLPEELQRSTTIQFLLMDPERKEAFMLTAQIDVPEDMKVQAIDHQKRTGTIPPIDLNREMYEDVEFMKMKEESIVSITPKEIQLLVGTYRHCLEEILRKR